MNHPYKKKTLTDKMIEYGLASNNRRAEIMLLSIVTICFLMAGYMLYTTIKGPKIDPKYYYDESMDTGNS